MWGKEEKGRDRIWKEFSIQAAMSFQVFREERGVYQARSASRTYSGINDACTDLAHIERVVIAARSVRIWMDVGGILPCLGEATIVEEDVALLELMM